MNDQDMRSPEKRSVFWRIFLGVLVVGALVSLITRGKPVFFIGAALFYGLVAALIAAASRSQRG